MHNFNPRSPHGERLRRMVRDGEFTEISIHAPRTGSDAGRPAVLLAVRGISIHAPRTGSDVVTSMSDISLSLFQSTLPARGATGGTEMHPKALTISIHAPRTGSDRLRLPRHAPGDISIHAPRTGSDCKRIRRADGASISIHAPRTGSDMRRALRLGFAGHFNPRSPHGERRTAPRICTSASRNFNPRSPHGERPRRTRRRCCPRWYFNPRSPHGERRCPA